MKLIKKTLQLFENLQVNANCQLKQAIITRDHIAIVQNVIRYASRMRLFDL